VDKLRVGSVDYEKRLKRRLGKGNTDGFSFSIDNIAINGLEKDALVFLRQGNGSLGCSLWRSGAEFYFW